MKGSERTEQAFKRLKAERKKDPLMQYLHQARNAEEHSIQEVTETVPGATTIGGGGPEFSKAFRASFSINNGVLGGVGGNPPEISPLDGKPVLIKQIGPQVKLKSVTNYGKKYPVPREHKGKEIEIPTPIEAAEFALSYLSEVLEKVRKIEAR
ncbi:hypothetical protein SAMN04488518_10652 [Pseudovibrio ascidiaceicola]|uniref:Phage protein, HK97 gp10 family n=2 Tax=Pseudovibrio ascidiaceicola TaxID=285279 RepID=A0A1I4A8I0_9HYPH|nr:hypothetical protein SAMN04488518_10652 [Pseudovibrio ascidiaceicola]